MILTLWQTRILRELRLTVRDEIENGLAYYRYTFLREVPRAVRAKSRTALAAAPGRGRHRGRADPAPGRLDRRRPRRQSLRHARRHARRR